MNGFLVSMGSGTSILSPEDSAVLTQILKEEYEKLMTEGYSEHDIQLKLTSKYNEIVSSITSESGNVSDENSRPGSQGSDSSGKKKRRRTLHGTTISCLFPVVVSNTDVSGECIYDIMRDAGNDRKSESLDAIALLKAARNGNTDEIEAVLDRGDVGLETISTDGVSDILYYLKFFLYLPVMYQMLDSTKCAAALLLR